MLKLFNNKGFGSILEVVVSSVIFMATAIGFFTSITMLRSQSAGSTNKLEALYIGKQVIEDLRPKVYGNTWSLGGQPLSTGVVTSLTTGAYTVNYMLEDVPGLPLRRLTMNVTYP